MTGTTPHNEKHPHESKRHETATARDVHATMPFRRANTHLRRPIYATPPRPTSQPTREPAALQAPVQDVVPIEPVTITHERPTQNAQVTVLQALNRAGRLTFDAMLLIVFAPVIALWWLNEKRHKR